VTEERGRQMFDEQVYTLDTAETRYMRFSHPFIPVMDPIYDTWERYVQT
jgi:hypothetical protein